jgi:predicted ATPase
MISSRMRGYENMRQGAHSAIIAAGMLAIEAEDPPPVGQTPGQFCKSSAEECDIFLLILGPLYGLPLDDQATWGGLSATHLEYQWASAKSKRKILVFVEHGAKDTPDVKQNAFIHEVLDFWKGQISAFFYNAEDLSERVAQALERWTRNNSLTIQHHLANMRARYSSLANPLTGASMTIELSLLLKLRQNPTRWPSSNFPSQQSDDESGTAEEFLQLLNRYVIVGDPGAGKTTLLKRLAFDSSRAGLDEVGEVIPRVAFYLTATDLGQQLLAEEGVTFAMAVARAVRSDESLSADASFEAYFEKGRVLLLIDGLDEVSSSRERNAVYETLRDRLGTNQAILTSRPASFQEAALPNWAIAEVQPLSEDDRDRLIHSVLDQLGNRMAVPMPNPAHVRQQIDQRSDLNAWAGNPLLLTLVAAVYITFGGIPEIWARIYRFAVEALIDSPYRQRRYRSKRLEQDRLELLLEAIALNLTEAGRVSASLQDLSTAFATNGYFTPTPGEIEEMLERASVLQQTESNVWGFVHRTFQEYFTATALVRYGREQLADNLRRHRFSARWEQPTHLLVSEFERLGLQDDADNVVHQLLTLDTQRVEQLNGQDPLHLSLLRAAHCQGMRHQLESSLSTELAQKWFSHWESQPEDEAIRLIATSALAALQEGVRPVLARLGRHLRVTDPRCIYALDLVDALIPSSRDLIAQVAKLSTGSSSAIRTKADLLLARMNSLVGRSSGYSPTEPGWELFSTSDLEGTEDDTASKKMPVNRALSVFGQDQTPDEARARIRKGVIALLLTIGVGAIPVICVWLISLTSNQVPPWLAFGAWTIASYIVYITLTFAFFASSLDFEQRIPADTDLQTRTVTALAQAGSAAISTIPKLVELVRNPPMREQRLLLSRTLASLLALTDDIDKLTATAEDLNSIVDLPAQLEDVAPVRRKLGFHIDWFSLLALIILPLLLIAIPNAIPLQGWTLLAAVSAAALVLGLSITIFVSRIRRSNRQRGIESPERSEADAYYAGTSWPPDFPGRRTV